jgi:hypothetical protein
MNGRVGSDLDKSIELNPIHPDSPAVRQAAARTVCAHAHDVTDAHYLLTMLGLEERP